MKYMLMSAGDEDYYAVSQSFPGEKQKEALERVAKWWDEQMAAGRLLEGHGLQPTSTATTVRIQMSPAGESRRALVTDGPFIDAKERIGGHPITHGPDTDPAVAVATDWRAVGPVDSRAIHHLPGLARAV